MQSVRKVIITGVLILALTVGMFTPAMARNTSFFSETEHGSTHYSDMTYDFYDGKAFLNKANKLKDLSESSGNGHAVINVFDELMNDMAYIETQYNLASIRYYQNINDDTTQQEEARMALVWEDCYDAFSSAISDVLDSGYSRRLTTHMGRENAYGFKDYEDVTEDQRNFSIEETNLVQEYYNLLENDFSSLKKMNKVLGEHYVKMVDLRARYAQSYDIDSYGELASFATYGREYTYEKVQEFFDNVKRYIVPLYINMEGSFPNEYEREIRKIESVNNAEIFKMVEPHISSVSDEYRQAWDYLMRYGLYDMEPSDTKGDVGFTVSLPSYGAAFIFDSPYNSLLDISTVIHEFGHFANDYFDDTPSMYITPRFDLFEIHSQGLEMLFLEYYKDMFGSEERAQAMRYSEICDMLSVIVQYSYLSELEFEVYANPGMNLDEINALSSKIALEYGEDYGGDEQYIWCYYDHLFSSPMYTLSYAVSAMSALDIWMLSQQNYNDAADAYLELVSYSCTYPLQEALDKSGLSDTFSAGFCQELLTTVTNVFELGETTVGQPSLPVKRNDREETAAGKEARQLKTAETIGLVTFFVVAIVLVIIGVTHASKRRRQMRQSQMQYPPSGYPPNGYPTNGQPQNGYLPANGAAGAQPGYGQPPIGPPSGNRPQQPPHGGSGGYAPNQLPQPYGNAPALQQPLHGGPGGYTPNQPPQPYGNAPVPQQALHGGPGGYAPNQPPQPYGNAPVPQQPSHGGPGGYAPNQPPQSYGKAPVPQQALHGGPGGYATTQPPQSYGNAPAPQQPSHGDSGGYTPNQPPQPYGNASAPQQASPDSSEELHPADHLTQPDVSTPLQQQIPNEPQADDKSLDKPKAEQDDRAYLDDLLKPPSIPGISYNWDAEEEKSKENNQDNQL